MYLRMGALYGHAWKRDHGTNSDLSSVNAAEWATTLRGLSRKQIDAGLQACRAGGSEFPPSAPRFLAMCLGVPSLARVINELSKPALGRSRFTWAVWRLIDHHRLKSEDSRTADRMVRDAYEVVKEDVMSRRPLPEPPILLEGNAQSKPARVPHSREKVRQFLDVFGQALHEPGDDARSENETRKRNRE